MGSTRAVCVHGHFYQPPREDPWTGRVPEQTAAAPYHDWNERITAECYAPNAAARIVGDDGETIAELNNYGHISFDIGPTLMQWLAINAPQVHAAVVEGDRAGRARFGGHGTAMAQAYHHLIMPLANDRDVETQVAWGVRDFEHRFGRHPEGMWLPETAVDLRSLEAMARHGIAFTILEPHQIARVRRDDGDWRDGTDADPREPHLVRLPSGATIAIFLYSGDVARAIAFEGALSDGHALVDLLEDQFDRGREHPQLVSVATDGESYGHHHRFGEMALAYALREIERRDGLTLTNYGEHLEWHPPTSEVQVREGTSWSCEHGVERWRSDCGCSAGGHDDWDQAWRAPLRAALDWLRDELASAYEAEAGHWLRDPWRARDAYIDVVLDRSPATVDAFLAQQGADPVGRADRDRVIALLELQQFAMGMFTSCGWFFDDLGRIETKQVLRYAARALDLARGALALDLEPEFLERLSLARSNDPERGDGRAVYRAALEISRTQVDPTR